MPPKRTARLIGGADQSIKVLDKKIPSYMRKSSSNLLTNRDRSNQIPYGFLLRDLHDKRKFRFLSRKLTMFITFVAIYVSVLILDRNISGRAKVQRILNNALLETSLAASGITFSGIHSIATCWDWLQNSLMPMVYSTINDDGSPRTNDQLYTVASHTKIVGGFHMFQTRYARIENASSPQYKNDPCYTTTYTEILIVCYSSKHEDNSSFGPLASDTATIINKDPIDPSIIVPITDLNATRKSLSMFAYNATIGGYEAFFLRSATSGEHERQLMTLMRLNSWIDEQTKTVEIRMPLYNANLKIWSVVVLDLNFDLAGGVTADSFIHVTNIEPYDFAHKKNFIRVILEMIFLAHAIYFLLLEMWDICVLSSGSVRIYMRRYGVWNNLGDWSNIIVNWAIVGWRYSCQHNSTRLEMLAITSFDQYVDVFPLAIWDEILLALNICNMLFLTARTLKYFQITRGGKRLMRSVYGAMPKVVSFLPIYLAVVIGYTFVGHMLYGLAFVEWSTFPSALFRVFELNFGLYDPGSIYDNNGYLSAVFIYSSNVVFAILLLNVFMAIVMSTWDAQEEKESEQAKEREQYSKSFGVKDFVFLITMSEDLMDEIIDIVTDLDQQDFVSKAVFVQACKENLIPIPKKTLDVVVDWYWLTDIDLRLLSQHSTREITPSSPSAGQSSLRKPVTNKILPVAQEEEEDDTSPPKPTQEAHQMSKSPSNTSVSSNASLVMNGNATGPTSIIAPKADTIASSKTSGPPLTITTHDPDMHPPASKLPLPGQSTPSNYDVHVTKL